MRNYNGFRYLSVGMEARVLPGGYEVSMDAPQSRALHAAMSSSEAHIRTSCFRRMIQDVAKLHAARYLKPYVE